jgi:hypothetical protein
MNINHHSILTENLKPNSKKCHTAIQHPVKFPEGIDVLSCSILMKDIIYQTSHFVAYLTSF